MISLLPVFVGRISSTEVRTESLERQDSSLIFRIRFHIQNWGRLPKVGLGLSLALLRTFGADLRRGGSVMRTRNQERNQAGNKAPLCK